MNVCIRVCHQKFILSALEGNVLKFTVGEQYIVLYTELQCSDVQVYNFVEKSLSVSGEELGMM